jgi:glucokinase
MNSNEVVIGIDIGGTTTAFGLVDRQGNLRAEGGIPTQAQLPAETLVARLHEKIGALRKSLAADVLLRGIGIGAPNANTRSGTVENPPNLKWGASVNLVQLFQRHYDLPVAITNDANAAALGEMHFGGARGMSDFIVITLGTGLGSGIVANSELICGACGSAGELGHTVVDPDGRVCACGKKGCLETYVSAGGLCRTAFALLAERNDASPLRTFSYQQLTARMVSEAAEKGDAIALAAFDATARILGIKLADAVAHTGPEAIFLFGGLAAAGNLLLVPTQRYMEDFLFRPYSGKVKLLRSPLPEGSAAVLGAAALIWHGILK